MDSSGHRLLRGGSGDGESSEEEDGKVLRRSMSALSLGSIPGVSRLVSKSELVNSVGIGT